jgi:LPS export ABC transporter protein LptC
MRALLLGAALAVGIGVAGCRKTTQPPVTGDAALADSADQVLHDVRYMLTQNGIKRGQLFADTMFVFGDQSRFVLRRVRSNFSTETGAPYGTMRGDRGTYDLRTQVLEGFGNVVVTSTDGRRLTSNHLRFSQAQNRISSDSAYTLVRGSDTQTGIGFVSDPNLNEFRCLRSCGGSGLVPLGSLPQR